jgi:uncharacterized peroxidase-related enzyme
MPATIKRVEPQDNEQLAELERKSGKPNPLYRTMANRPEALRQFVPFYKAIMGPGGVDRRIKELAYLAASYANECPFCLASHMETGRKAGITDEEMRALQLEQDHGFSPQEKAVIHYSRELTRTATGEDSVDDLFSYFTDEQIVEITLVAAMANFTNRFNNGLNIKPED